MTETIPYHRPYPLSEREKVYIQTEVQGVLESGMLTNNYYVNQLENDIKDIHDVKYVVATSSCTQALLITLHYLYIQKEEIIQTTSFNWKSISYLIKRFATYINDIERDTWLPADWANHPSIYLHTFGNIGESIGSKKVIYDGSHCLGADFEDIGLATCISLAPTKLVTSCEGGLILTNNEYLYKFAVGMRDVCSRMSEVHALIGLEYLKHLDEIFNWKKETYKYYRSNIPGKFQKISFNSTYNTIAFLNTENLTIPESIETKQYYKPLYGGLKNTDYVYKNIVCLPSWYGLDREDVVNRITEVNEL